MNKNKIWSFILSFCIFTGIIKNLESQYFLAYSIESLNKTIERLSQTNGKGNFIFQFDSEDAEFIAGKMIYITGIIVIFYSFACGFIGFLIGRLTKKLPHKDNKYIKNNYTKSNDTCINYSKNNDNKNTERNDTETKNNDTCINCTKNNDTKSNDIENNDSNN